MTAPIPHRPAARDRPRPDDPARARRQGHAGRRPSTPSACISIRRSRACDAATATAFLKSFVLLNAWLRREVAPDATRNLLGFADPFPADYVRRLVVAGLLAGHRRPSSTTISPPTRPGTATSICCRSCIISTSERVRAVLPNEKINGRPTFHYRLPDARVSDPGWSIAPDWNRWVAVERLAADRERLDAVGAAYLSFEGEDKSWADVVGAGRAVMTQPPHRRHHVAARRLAQLPDAPARARPRRARARSASSPASRCRRSPCRASSSAAATISAPRSMAARFCPTCASTPSATSWSSTLLEGGPAGRPAGARHLPRLADDQRGARRHAAHRHLRGLRAGAEDAHGPAEEDGSDRARHRGSTASCAAIPAG